MDGRNGYALEGATLDERRLRMLLDATSAVGQTVATETRLGPILQTIAGRGRQLVAARALLAFVEDSGAIIVAAGSGEVPDGIMGTRLPIDSAAWRGVATGLRPERTEPPGPRLARVLRRLGLSARETLLVPLAFHGRRLGILIALDREGYPDGFDDEDEELLAGFAAFASMGVATARSLAELRLRESIEIAERERARWARELHDETLQGLGALRVRLAASLRAARPETMNAAVAGAVAQIEDEIANLRALITELRPAALDELGLGAAIGSLAETHGASTEIAVHLDLALEREDGVAPQRLDREIESAVYRVVQEALTNVAKHARAENVWIEVAENEGSIEIVVRDDGVGFDMDARGHGFGLVGMRERVALRGGTLTIVSTPGAGTELRSRIPTESVATGLLRG